MQLRYPQRSHELAVRRFPISYGLQPCFLDGYRIRSVPKIKDFDRAATGSSQAAHARRFAEPSVKQTRMGAVERVTARMG